MTEDATRRKPWLAGLLSLAVPGLGQLYNGEPWRALTCYLLHSMLQVATTVVMVKLPLPGAALALPLVTLGLVRLVGIPLDAFLRARRSRQSYRLRAFNRWPLYLAVVAFEVAASLVITPNVTVPVLRVWMGAFSQVTGSMEPTLVAGDHFLVDMSAYRLSWPFSGRTLLRLAEPRRGDVVVLRVPEDRNRMFVKRVIALPGETVGIRGRTVQVDGVPLSEGYVRFLFDDAGDEPPDELRFWGPQVVPPGRLFVLGDNRDNSRDSRFFGFVPVDDVLGRTVAVYWSVEMPLEYVEGERPAGRIRWSRFGLRVR